MKKILVAVCAFAIVSSFALAASPTWVGVSVNTNTGTVKPGVLEQRLSDMTFGFETNTCGTYSITNYLLGRYGLSLGPMNLATEPWTTLTNFYGITHTYGPWGAQSQGPWGSSTTISSIGTVSLATPGGYFRVGATGPNKSVSYSSVPVEAPGFSSSGDITLDNGTTNVNAETAPSVLFNRGTASDTHTDWKIANIEVGEGDSGLEFLYRKQSTGGNWALGAKINSDDGKVVAQQGFIGNGDGLTVNSTNLGEWVQATSTNVASVERRTSALEGSASEYWCKWTDASLSASGTNWIPTNWPARTVYCFLICDNADYNVYLPNWTPDDECTLHMRVSKTATGTISLRTEYGVSLASMTSSNAIYREFEIIYRKGAGWVVSFPSLASPSYVVDGVTRQSIEDSALPEGGDFAPVVK